MSQGVVSSELRRRLRRSMRRALRATETPGATAAVLLDGEPLFAAAVGTRNLAGLQSLDFNARFPIYSVTKTLLALVTLQLADEGVLSLDAPVRTYLRELALDPGISVRRLLNHTAGLPDYGGLPAYSQAVRDDPRRPWGAEGFLAETLPLGPLFPPGEGFSYSNIGYLIVRLMLERLTGQPLRRILHERVFAPLRLERTFVYDTLEDAHLVSPGYSSFFSDDGSLADVAPSYHPGWVSHGLVVSTAPELARMIDAILSGRLLRPALLQAMVEPVLVSLPERHPVFPQPAYGLGLMLDGGSPHGLVAGHSGGGPGYSAGALHLSTSSGTRLTSAVLANRDVSDLGLHLAFALARIALNHPGSAAG